MTDPNAAFPHGQQPYPQPGAQPYSPPGGQSYPPGGGQPYQSPYGGQPSAQQSYPPGAQPYSPPGQQPYQPSGGQAYPPGGQPSPPYSAQPYGGQPGAQPYGGQPGQPPYPPGGQSYQPPGGQPHPPQAPAPAGGRKTGKTVMLVALGLVVLLGIGAGTAWYVTGGFGGGEELGAGEWSVPFTGAGVEVIGTDASIAFGAWMTDKAVIRAQKDGVLAYDLNTGKRTWGVPSPGEQLCSAAPTIAGGTAVVAYGTTKVCDGVAGIDTATGKVTWKVKVAAGKAESGKNATLWAPTLEFAGDIAAVRTDKVVTGLRLSDGKKLWNTGASKACRTTNMLASPKQVIVNLDCYEGGDSVVALNSRTGDVMWEYRVEDGPSYLLSADPVVAAWEGGTGARIELLEAGKKVQGFETKEKIDLLRLNDTIYIRGGHEEMRALVHGSTLYLGTFPENTTGGGIHRNNAVAYDLKTGNRLWVSSGTGASLLTFVAADGKGLLAMEAGGNREPAPRLVRLDAATGKAASVAELPQAAGGESDDARVYYRDGRLVIMPFEKIAAGNAITALRVAAE
ncbi:PQQ-binding-like beta-propeller repeat protein [Streptosporangium sp. NPDC000396]|uniref:outer membrane protein assembly factor BamB family protein n=1 Tax=Streptosporangium sp. NPDC000396 TaxID=3366185 RepID=UPI00367799A3